MLTVRKMQTRAILHDDRLFPDPFTFKPERFTTPDMDPRVPAAVDYAFGFGRRVCPGRWMAHSFVWIVVASVLSTLRIEKAVRDGRVIEPTGAFTPGILACVLSFFVPDIFSRSAEQKTIFFFIVQESGKIRVLY
jgi:cytochrome P450